ncbi:MAG TPA: FtsQ-type POTRA domain-containing protein [Gaiellaceae bacterium]|nr:FtsQ-type POTRA domain-containing protein [Gaiellaceae bacterium]
MVGGRTGRGSRRRTSAASVVVPFPRDVAGDRLELVRLVPSGRTLLLAFGVLTAVLAAYWGALATSVFAVRSVEVQGAPAEVARQVEAAAADAVGRSLLSVDPGEIEDAVRALPTVAGVSVDRSFPHTLRVKVAPERPVAVARKAREAWLVAGSGKVIRAIELGTERRYPRVWLTREVTPRPGRHLPAEMLPTTRALAAVGETGLRRRVKSVRLARGSLVVVLRRGPELRLGDPVDVALKLTVAGRVLPLVDAATAYLDVSVPERPVAGTTHLDSQVEVES